MMIADWFQLGSIPANAMAGTYDYGLVFLSYVIAVMASYVALDLTGRLQAEQNTTVKLYWLLGGAFAMGAGIWSMHFIGMLAFSMTMPMSYDLFWTGISMMAAVLVSGFAFYLLRNREQSLFNLMMGGIILGLGIATMHYLGMTGMTSHMVIHYLPGLFILSIVIAIVASEVALWLISESTQGAFYRQLRFKSLSALVMGAAICGMHYTGMAAAIFTPAHTAVAADYFIPSANLAIYIACATLLIITIALIASTYRQLIDRAVYKQEQLLTEQKILTARHVGMTEVADSVLHNIGNVLNSVNVSATMVSNDINSSKVDGLLKVKELIQNNRHDLATFITTDAQGSHLPEYLIQLADNWQEAKSVISLELASLTKNIQHIKDIVSMQQNLSKSVNLVDEVQVSELLEDALTINKVNYERAAIQITRDYQAPVSIIIDRAKLLQILINLVRNAIDALAEIESDHKTLFLTITKYKNNYVSIQVRDNGIGIVKDNITNIFSHGFTTKKRGHGFGLHTSALVAQEMGGKLMASSPGLNQGATFELILPLAPVAKHQELSESV